MSDHIVETAGARLAVTDVGEGEPIVALHASVADKRIWERCAEMWVGAGYRVVCYDQRGYGDTEAESNVSFRPVDDLWAVMDDRGFGQAVLVGNSMGGRVAADGTLERPERVSSLVLIGTSLSGAPEVEPDDSIKEIVDRYDAAEESEDIALLNPIEAHFWLDGPNQPEGRVGGSGRELFLTMNGRALELHDTIGEMLWADDSWDRLAEIEVPTLLLVGEYDAGFIMDRSRSVAAAIPNAEMVVIPESAHLPPLDAPAVLATMVTEFLTGR